MTTGPAHVNARLFGIETKTDLAPILASLGMPSAFDDRADFSGITTSVVLRADRPFLFAVRDVPTGAILFLGRVGDPSIGP
jgi:serine protease inhibitor